MTESTKTTGFDPQSQAHIDSMHRLGRIGILFALIIMLGMPIIAGIYFHAIPSLGRIITASIGLIALFLPITLSELIAYTPIFGSSIYLTLITGNVSNLKLPVANMALKLLDVESGTEDADIVTSIAVSVSSFVTIVVIILGVLLITPLTPFLSLPAVKSASGYILPALFGSLALGLFSSNLGGGIRAKGRLKSGIAPVVIMALIYILFAYVLHMPQILQLQGFIMLLLLPITYGWTKMLFTKGQIKVLLPGE